MTTAIPTSAAELEELLGDQAKVNASVADGTFTDIVKAYATKVAKDDADLGKQIKVQAQAAIAEFFRNDPDALERARPLLDPNAQAASRGHHYNAEADGAVLTGQYKNLRDFLMTTYRAEKRGSRPDQERLAKIANEFASAVPESGGSLIPEEFRSEMLTTMMPEAIVRPRARVIPMGSPRVNIPMLEDTNHTVAAGYYGGIVTFWTGEGDALTASAPKWGAVTLDSNDLTAYTEIPNQLVQDSAISVTGFVEQSFPAAMRDSEDEAFLWGNGVKKPLGVLHADNSAAITVAKETAQPADTIVWENIIKMYARMIPTSLSGAVWIINPECLPELMTMAISVGTGGSAVFQTQAQSGPSLSLLGRPIILSEKAAGIGDLGDVNLVDFSHYLIGDRQQMASMWSEHFRFNTNTQAYRIIQRLDGRPWLQNPITPRRGSATLSPFVKLAAR